MTRPYNTRSRASAADRKSRFESTSRASVFTVCVRVFQSTRRFRYRRGRTRVIQITRPIRNHAAKTVLLSYYRCRKEEEQNKYDVKTNRRNDTERGSTARPLEADDCRPVAELFVIVKFRRRQNLNLSRSLSSSVLHTFYIIGSTTTCLRFRISRRVSLIMVVVVVVVQSRRVLYCNLRATYMSRIEAGQKA